MAKRNAPLREVVSNNLKAARIREGLTQKELADRVGLKVQYISRLETMPQNITIDLLEKLAQGLGCGIKWLVIGFESKELAPKRAEELDQAIQLLRAFRSRL